MAFTSEQKTAIVIAIITAVSGLTGTIVVNQCKSNTEEKKSSIIKKNDNSDIAVKISNALIRERYDEVNDNFSEFLKIQLPTNKLKYIYDSLKVNLGEYHEQTGVNSVMIHNLENVTVSCRFSKKNLAVTSVFDNNGDVIGLWIKEFDK